MKSRTILRYNPTTLKKVGSIGGDFRLCCGIFGIAANKAGEVFATNLGAFHVDRFSAAGKKLSSFGKRGGGEDEFHGCCNPCNIVALPDGRILTMEKGGLRLKIYDAKGEKCLQVVEGFSDFGSHCSYLPMTADSTGVVYMAGDDFFLRCTKKGA
jgi:hypothetical protein